VLFQKQRYSKLTIEQTNYLSISYICLYCACFLQIIKTQGFFIPANLVFYEKSRFRLNLQLLVKLIATLKMVYSFRLFNASRKTRMDQLNWRTRYKKAFIALEMHTSCFLKKPMNLANAVKKPIIFIICPKLLVTFLSFIS